MKLQNLLTCRDKAESHLGFIQHFPISGIISRYRELEFPISGNQFPISGNDRFSDIGKWFSDIGNWFSDIGKCAWFPDIGKSIPDIRKSPPDRSRSLRHPATPPYHTAPYQQRPPAIPVPSACGLIRAHLYDFSKSISATNNNHTTDDFAKKCTWEICGAELMSLMILTRTEQEITICITI